MTQSEGEITYPGDPMCLYAALSVAVHRAVADAGPLEKASHYTDLAPEWTRFPGKEYRLSAGGDGFRPYGELPNTDQTVFDPRVWDDTARARWIGLLREVRPRTVLISTVSPGQYVFLAAGSMGTSKLLVRAKGRGSLPDLPDGIGRFWGDNADRLAIRVGMPGPPSTGGPAHIVATDWRDPATAISLAEFPGGSSPAPGEGVSGTFAMQITEPDGSFAYDSASDSVHLTYPNDDAGLDTVLGGVLDRLNAANPGTRTYSTTAAYTSHPLGGAVLGHTCGSDGTVLGHPNLFVVDSSLIPGSTGAVTPALTVTARASRTVTRAIRTLQRQS
ncbi:GMC oxidoreductase [Streptomyces sp. NPDC006235]|uniref:GMC oxidoreductase n=1 Tax=Streptomyces sp. NPDC006235 TaxID=3156736 RepID=UPI0033AF277B